MWPRAICLLIMWAQTVNPYERYPYPRPPLPSPYRPTELCDPGMIAAGVFCRHSYNARRSYYLSCRHRQPDGRVNWGTPVVRVLGDCPLGYLCLRHGPPRPGRWQPSAMRRAQIDCVRSDLYPKRQPKNEAPDKPDKDKDSQRRKKPRGGAGGSGKGASRPRAGGPRKEIDFFKFSDLNVETWPEPGGVAGAQLQLPDAPP